jgi:hypothetical protein
MDLVVVANGREVKFGNFVKQRAKQIVEAAKEVIPAEAKSYFVEAILKKEGWNRPFVHPASADYDMEQESEDSPMSIIDAIKYDLNNAHYKKGDVEFRLGNVPILESLAPRVLYYEFGTLAYQENTSALGIGSFSTYKPAGIQYSALRQKLGPGVSWGFLQKEGVGRFGEGVMIPSGSAAPPFKGIPPVRMYRASGEIAFQKLRTNRLKIIGKISKVVKKSYVNG